MIFFFSLEPAFNICSPIVAPLPHPDLTSSLIPVEGRPILAVAITILLYCVTMNIGGIFLTAIFTDLDHSFLHSLCISYEGT